MYGYLMVGRWSGNGRSCVLYNGPEMYIFIFNVSIYLLYREDSMIALEMVLKER